MFKLALLTVALCASMASGGHSYSYSSPGSCKSKTSKSETKPNGDFKCYNGEWIPASWRCDDWKDCFGPCGEDELKVNCLSTIDPEEGTDRPSETEEGTGRSDSCIALAAERAERDSLALAEYGTEYGTEYNGDFQCYNGYFIPASWRCNDWEDCPGFCGEDELDCPSTIDDGTQMVNVALAGTASQDSIGWGGEPERAIDGNTDGDYWGSSCSHTRASSNTWWKVELEQEAVIDHVIVFNREDCCSDRINGAKVYVVRGSEPATQVIHLCGTIQYTDGTTRYEIGCGAEAGDAVLIKGASYLTLCEVRVMADPSKEVPAADE